MWEEVDLPRKEPDVLVARLKHRALYTRLPDGEIRAVKTVKDSVQCVSSRTLSR